MPEMPAGAQLSPDGYYWWDADHNQWQLVEHGGAGAGSSAAPAGATSSDPRVQARIAAGLPAEVHAATPEQRQPYVNQPTVEVAVESADQTDVPELSTEHQGEMA